MQDTRQAQVGVEAQRGETGEHQQPPPPATPPISQTEIHPAGQSPFWSWSIRMVPPSSGQAAASFPASYGPDAVLVDAVLVGEKPPAASIGAPPAPPLPVTPPLVPC